MADPILTLALTFLLLGLMLGPLLMLAGIKVHRLGKAFIVLIDRDGRSVSWAYRRIKDGSFNVGDRDYLLDGTAKHGGKYSTWLVDKTTGVCYRAPTRKEGPDVDLKTAILEASNPESYHRAQRRLGWRGVLAAGEETNKWGWVFPVAIIALVAIVLTLGAVLFMLTKLGNVAGGAAGGVG